MQELVVKRVRVVVSFMAIVTATVSHIRIAAGGIMFEREFRDVIRERGKCIKS